MSSSKKAPILRSPSHARPSKTGPSSLSKRVRWGLGIGGVLLCALFVGLYLVAQAKVLPTDDQGRVQTNAEQWLVYNVGRRDSPRYQRFGRIEAAQGYVLEKTDYTYNENERIFYFVPTDADEPLIRYSAMVADGAYDRLVEQSLLQLTGTYPDAVSTPVRTVRLPQGEVRYYAYHLTLRDAQTGTVTYDTHAVNAYVKADGAYSILLMLELRDAQSTGDEAGIEEALGQVLSGLTVE